MLRDCTPESVRSELPGRTVVDVDRLGKFLIIRLDGEDETYLTIHLGMTGQILVSTEQPGRGDEVNAMRADPAEARHTRFVLLMEGSPQRHVRLEFRDMRKFGRLHLTHGGPAPRLQRLGPDAWMGDWDGKYLSERLRGRRAPIKGFLLDQRHLAGIGNIYADETLWWSQISPLREGGSLDAGEIDRLAEEIRARLDEGVRRLGCTLADFVDIEGRPGSFQERLQAYGRQGRPCFRCGETLVRAERRRAGGRRIAPDASTDLQEKLRRKKIASPECTRFASSTALTSSPLRCTPRPFTSAFPLRVPL